MRSSNNCAKLNLAIDIIEINHAERGDYFADVIPLGCFIIYSKTVSEVEMID